MNPLSLISYGTQDVYLTQSPQISFFKSIYQRFTNFKSDISDLDNNPNNDFGKSTTITINRSGDLITPVYLNPFLITPSLGLPKYICPKVECNTYFAEDIEDNFDPTLFNISDNNSLSFVQYDLHDMKDIANTIIVEI